MKKILIVDDHGITRIGLKTMMSELYPGKEIYEARDGNEATNLVKANSFELITLDINMPETDSVDLIKKFKQKQPDVKILVISMNNEEIYGVSVLKNGANGFISKDNPFDVIKGAVITVMDGKKYIGEKVLGVLIGGKGIHEPENPFQKLSAKELFIAQLIIDGFSTKEIAFKTNLQWTTISTYKNRIFEKLQVNSPFELLELSKANNFVGIKTYK